MITIYKTVPLSTQYCIKTHWYMGATGHREGGGGVQLALSLISRVFGSGVALVTAVNCSFELLIEL